MTSLLIYTYLTVYTNNLIHKKKSPEFKGQMEDCRLPKRLKDPIR